MRRQAVNVAHGRMRVWTRVEEKEGEAECVGVRTAVLERMSQCFVFFSSKRVQVSLKLKLYIRHALAEGQR